MHLRRFGAGAVIVAALALPSGAGAAPAPAPTIQVGSNPVNVVRGTAYVPNYLDDTLSYFPSGS